MATRKDTAWGARLDGVFHELEDMKRQASTPNWDGYGAQPIREEALEEARAVLEILPSEFSLPEPSVEPDGSIGLEWHARPGWTYVLSVSGRGELEYAGIFGESETHGKELFRGVLPPLVSEHLRRLAPRE